MMETCYRNQGKLLIAWETEAPLQIRSIWQGIDEAVPAGTPGEPGVCGKN